MLRMVKEGGSAAVGDAEVPVTDRFFENKLPLDRLRMTSSFDLGAQFDHVSGVGTIGVVCWIDCVLYLDVTATFGSHKSH